MPDEYIQLAEAIALVRKKHPWLSESSLRDAVRKGHVPHRRGSPTKKAHYIVRMEDLQKYINTLIIGQEHET